MCFNFFALCSRYRLLKVQKTSNSYIYTQNFVKKKKYNKDEFARNINDLYVLGTMHEVYSRQMLIGSLAYLQGFCIDGTKD